MGQFPNSIWLICESPAKIPEEIIVFVPCDGRHSLHGVSCATLPIDEEKRPRKSTEGTKTMKPTFLIVSLILNSGIAFAEVARSDIFEPDHEIARIDPGKTLDLIKRIKTAKDGVAS